MYHIDICSERGFFLVNTFQLRVIHTYTRARENERSLIGYVAVDSIIG